MNKEILLQNAYMENLNNAGTETIGTKLLRDNKIQFVSTPILRMILRDF
jgi:hypothetical protein